MLAPAPKYPRQQAYKRRKRNGMVCVAPQVDPIALHDFLHDAGVFVTSADRETLKMGLEELLRRWVEGLVTVDYA